MSKGRITRDHILQTAFNLASKDGLDSLTIGQLAKASGMSKSGLFSHFNSKENLQIAVLEYTGEYFAHRVIQPARMAEPESIEKKLRLLLQNWLDWNQSFQGSCMFLDAWKDNSDTDNPVQLALLAITRRWLEYLCRQVEKAKQNGELKPELDTWQFVYRLYGVYLSSHLFRSLSLETDEHQRFWLGIEELMNEWRVQ
ncbi:TetR/AcrR family transcriptional regulator [Photobacterium chitinilyticum]|uniref:TetR/AcrR family transcriptional regulator n=1 Tax=Photobacterium chitinilyticum TaxID=2485123 RepID=A0A3S4TME0_9GAMM|nr:TetR/AcrR family transcriptional regulator [Photobacterium chitinilyticum]RWX55709.1 TetR/AcrR family transcriptional regulator [Photobacterium chitinilyticum]